MCTALAPEGPFEVAGSRPHAAEQLPHVRECSSQLRVPDFRRQRGVLQLGQSAVRFGNRPDRAVDERVHAGRRDARRGRLECAAWEAVAICELRMGAFRPPVGALDRSEELRLQSVCVVLVELLVRGAEIGERKPDL